MRFLIVNTDYPEFLDWFYARHPGLEALSYEEQMQARMKNLFGVADFYSSNLRKLGHQAWDIHANNVFMQKAWAQEYGVRPPSGRSWNLRIQAKAPWASKGIQRTSPWVNQGLHRGARWIRRTLSRKWLDDVLAAQIRHYAPDILLNQAMDTLSNRFFRRMKPQVPLLMGQIASPLPEGENLGYYDVVISSLPNFVENFRRQGIPGELHRLGFEPAILPQLSNETKSIRVSFVGALSRFHQGRIRLLEHLCKRAGLQVWGPGVGGLDAHSPIRDHYEGMAWGLDMYRVLRRSRITVNQHGEFTGHHANAMRLFEATGVGTLLITDWKEDLEEMFEPGKEIVGYRDPEECAALVRRYLENEDEREAIARAGQKRTLREHTYERRMRELIEIVERYS